MRALLEKLVPYGATEKRLRLFRGPAEPGLLPYATLLEPTEGQREDLLALQGVYEWQESPLIYLVDGGRIEGERHLRILQRLVALRGDARYLGAVEPGSLTIHAVGLDDTSPSSFELRRIQSTEPGARVTFSSLAMGALQPRRGGRSSVNPAGGDR